MSAMLIRLTHRKTTDRLIIPLKPLYVREHGESTLYTNHRRASEIEYSDSFKFLAESSKNSERWRDEQRGNGKAIGGM
jgi:hypothetical protein